MNVFEYVIVGGNGMSLVCSTCTCTCTYKVLNATLGT